MKLTFDGQDYRIFFKHIAAFPPNADGEVAFGHALNDWEEGKRTTIITHQTVCVVEAPTARVEGFADCSFLDQFSRAKGRAIALGRALAALRPSDQKWRKSFASAVRRRELGEA